MRNLAPRRYFKASSFVCEKSARLLRHAARIVPASSEGENCELVNDRENIPGKRASRKIHPGETVQSELDDVEKSECALKPPRIAPRAS